MYKYLSALLIVGLFPILCMSQYISDLHFEQAGKKIIIYYDLNGKKDYNVKVYCSTNNGKSWGSSLVKVTGDVGTFQKPGKDKMIIWDVLSERDELTGDIAFKIEASPAFKTYKSSFLPVFIPGARLNHYPRGKGIGTTKAVIFYGLAGCGVIFKVLADRQYDHYHQATTQEDMDKYYNNASTYHGLYQTALFLGIVVWGYDMLYYLFRGFEPVNNRVAVRYDQNTRAVNLTYVYKF